MDARLDARRAAMLALVVALSLLLAVLAPLTASAAVDGESTAETEAAVLEQVDPLAAGLAVTGLLVALGLVFLLARRLFKTS